MLLGFRLSMPGPTELILVFVLVLLIFGPSKLPQIGSAIGKGIREFRAASKDIQEQLKVEADEDTKG